MLSTSKEANPNYLAKIVQLKGFAFLEAESVQLDKGESDIESEN